ncbi:MAG: response regulator, partial [Rickettsiales bacterium]|nr:response regulator [Rickettsiales bacterium]
MSDTILLVEDDEMQRFLVSKMLSKELPYSVLSAENGHDALEIFKEETNIKAVILDLNMPKMDGIETLQKM